MEIKKLRNLFEKQFGAGRKPVHYFYAPGRVNLIGEHIDYNGGYVFPAALSLGISAALRFRDDNCIQLCSANVRLPVAVRLDEEIHYDQADDWGNYPKGVIHHLLQNGCPLHGCDILYFGDLPDGAGLSSSAAMLILTAYMLRQANGDGSIDLVQLAAFCQEVENQFIHVNCGIMDPFSVAMGKKDHAILLDCNTLKYRYVPLTLKDHSLVIMDTCKKRELAASKYNERRLECETALATIAKFHTVGSLCQAAIEDIDRYVADDVLRRRAHHVVSENGRVLMAVKLLENGDISGFGNLMIQSHMSLKNDYEVSGPELDAIVESALHFPGCIGARMTGAGFGGCAIALVENDRLEKFCSFVAEEYTGTTGLIPKFYVSSIANGVSMIQE
ncbi:MAG TPA: galactokinase [Ruminiclostridium sp.]|nr:galactokinase [Ruminiclostridium sp.]